MNKITVKDITGLIGPSTTVLLHDRKSEEGTVFEGPLMQMRTSWDAREVVWIRPYSNGFVLEIE